MDPLYAPRSRPERLIAAGRVVLAASSLLAVWLDPSEPAKYAGTAYGLLVAYLLYAVALAAAVWRAGVPGARWRLTTHAFDLAFFSLFIYFTAGTGSPFTAFFVFSLVCATLRWGWRGTLWTAVVSLAAFLGVGLWFGEIRNDPSFELYTFIIRGVYMAVVAVLLGYLGAHEERTRREIGQLATPPPQRVPDSLEEVLGEVLSWAARVIGSPRAALVWVEGEEPWHHLAVWSVAGLDLRREPPAALEPWVAEPLAAAGFLCDGAAAGRAVLRRVAGAGFERWSGEPLNPQLAARLGAHSVVSVPLPGETFEGRLFGLDRPGPTVDELVLAEAAGGLAAARLDHFQLTRRLRQVAATEERIRLARDLHDGVLQSLTGIALRLAAARRELEEEPAAGRERLEAVQRLIAVEQRDLRFFIQELRPAPERVAGEAPGIAARLGELIDRVEREWGLKVDLVAGDLDRDVPEPLTRDLYHLVREALVNAVRHGEASAVRVEVAVAADGGTTISVRDNGRGFPFEGRYTGEALAKMEAGPKTLRERVAALDGTLAVESGPAGARLEISLPRAVA